MENRNGAKGRIGKPTSIWILVSPEALLYFGATAYLLPRPVRTPNSPQNQNLEKEGAVGPKECELIRVKIASRLVPEQNQIWVDASECQIRSMSLWVRFEPLGRARLVETVAAKRRKGECL